MYTGSARAPALPPPGIRPGARSGGGSGGAAPPRKPAGCAGPRRPWPGKAPYAFYTWRCAGAGEKVRVRERGGLCWEGGCGGGGGSSGGGPIGSGMARSPPQCIVECGGRGAPVGPKVRMGESLPCRLWRRRAGLWADPVGTRGGGAAAGRLSRASAPRP